jgi:glycosyltransferase involved in cell wall biosynthesis
MDMKRTMLQLLLAGTAAWDGIACTSAAGRGVLERLAQVVREDLGLGEGARLNCDLRPIPLAVDTEVFRPRREEARQKLGWPQERFIFTCIGRLSPSNKMELVPLLKAYAMASSSSARGRYSRLYIIGREQVGGYAAVLMEMAKLCGVAGQVSIVTDYDGADIPYMHAASDCFVSPSDHVQETFGLTPLEAMASGVPPIVSDWDGYRETVIDGECGLTVPTWWAEGCSSAALEVPAATQTEYFFRLAQSVAVDVPALARAMTTLIENEDLRRQLGEAGRKRVLELYTWPRVIKLYEEWWAELRERLGRDKAGAACHNLFTFSHFEAFGHYPTHLVDEATQVRLSDRAAPVYPHVMELMDEGLCQEMSRLCPEWMSVGELFRALKLGPEGRERFNFNLMVLVKYDVLMLRPRP